jgi:hypothetical protein
MMLSAIAVTAQTAGNITYVFTTQGGVFFQCSNGKWTQSGLSMGVQTFVNGIGPSQPMAETGLPTIQFSWFINGAPAAATLTGAFGAANVASSGNVVSFSLQDDQPSIGGTFAIGTCTAGQALPAITVSMTSTTFINGQGVPPTIPAVSGVPHIVNNFPAANNAGSTFNGGATTVPATVAPTVPATVAPTVKATVAPTVPATVAPTTAAATVAPTTAAATVAPTTPATATGNITYTIATVGGVQFMCSGGKWTDFGLSMTVQAFINGIGPNIPMAETGLPTIKLSWFVAGAAAPATLTGAFGVANVVNAGNVVSFDLRDDQPSIGGTFAVGACTAGQAQPAISVSMSSTSFIVGQGVAPTIPAVSGVPHIVNLFPAANNAGSVFNQDVATSVASTSSPSQMQTPLIAAGVGILAFGCVAGLAVFGVRRFKQRKSQSLPFLRSPLRGSQTQLSVYVAQNE